MRPSHSQKNWLGQTAERYHRSLDETTLSYLAGRGLDRDAVIGALLGLVVDPDPAHEQYAGRLSIPFLTPTGTVHLRFRCLIDHGEERCDDLWHGKYEGPKGEETRLYNVLAMHERGDQIGVCEGELDALMATKAGLPSVGVSGAHAWKPHYYRLFDDYERVVVLGDGDEAGRTFTATLAHNLPNAIRRPLPAGHDVTSYVLEQGAEKFLQFIGEG